MERQIPSFLELVHAHHSPDRGLWRIDSVQQRGLFLVHGVRVHAQHGVRVTEQVRADEGFLDTGGVGEVLTYHQHD